MKSNIIVLRFATFEDPDTLAKRIEAKAIDPATDTPVVSMSLQMMSHWLRRNGYRWRFGSSGIWERVRVA